MTLRTKLPKHDAIAELETASLDRLGDAFVLASSGRMHAAIYLLGYYFEISLKTLFFRCFGFEAREPIREVDLKAASQLAREQLKVFDPWESFHNPVFWTRALIALRTSFQLPTPQALSQELAWRSQRMYDHWAIRMRYVSSRCDQSDWEQVCEDALWLRANYDQLTTVLDRGGA